MGNSTPTAWLYPDFFVGKPMLSAYEPYPVLTASQFSSIPPASAAFIHWNQPAPVAVKNIIVQNTLNASVPQATSANSSGSEAFSYAYSAFIYSRSDYAANSTQLAPMVSGSLGVTGTISYSSGSQSFGLSWVTDTTGGTSAFTTTSGDGGWSAFASGVKQLSIPLVTTLPAGEYFIGFQHSSSTATSNSNVTLLSFSQLQVVGQQASISAGVLGANATTNSLFYDVAVLNASPTFSTTMPISSLSIAGRPVWFQMSNA